jgi:hypothetical protein
MSAVATFISRHRLFGAVVAATLLVGIALILTLYADAEKAATPPAKTEPTDRLNGSGEASGPSRRKTARNAVLPPLEGAAPLATEVRAQLREVFNGPDFKQPDSSLSLIPRQPEKPKETNSEMADWAKWLTNLFSPTTARIVTWLMWALAAVLAVFLLWMVWQWFRRWQADHVPEIVDENAAIRIALKLDELSEDVVSEAERAWAGGDATLALSLLYRGALKYLLDQRGLKLRRSLTEGECMRAVAHQVGGSTAGDFDTITRAWSRVAYAASAPAEFTSFAAVYRRAFMAAAPSPETRA